MDRYANDAIRFPGKLAVSGFLHTWGEMPGKESNLHTLPGMQASDESKVFTMQNDSPKELITPVDSLYLSGKRINHDKE